MIPRDWDLGKVTVLIGHCITNNQQKVDSTHPRGLSTKTGATEIAGAKARAAGTKPVALEILRNRWSAAEARLPKMLLLQNYLPPLASNSKMVAKLLARRPIIITTGVCLVITLSVLQPSFRLAPLPSPSAYFAGAPKPCSIDDTRNNTLGVSPLSKQTDML